MWGVIPAAGAGSRIQPLAFSKELLPVGSRIDGSIERPRAVSEYLVDRLLAGGAAKLCFVVAPNKSDILNYYGGGKLDTKNIAFVVQPHPAGLCDAIFRAAPLIPGDEPVAVGLPDTIWFPENGLRALPDDRLSFLLFPVENPALFDVVVTDESGNVMEIEVKPCNPKSRWIWGAFKMPGAVFHELHRLWRDRGGVDAYFGTLINAWIARGGSVAGIRAGTSYVDVGSLNGYRQAITLLTESEAHAP